MLFVAIDVGPSVIPPAPSCVVIVAIDAPRTDDGVVTPAIVKTTAVFSPMSSSQVPYVVSGRSTPATQLACVLPVVVMTSVRVDELHRLLPITSELG